MLQIRYKPRYGASAAFLAMCVAGVFVLPVLAASFEKAHLFIGCAYIGIPGVMLGWLLRGLGLFGFWLFWRRDGIQLFLPKSRRAVAMTILHEGLQINFKPGVVWHWEGLGAARALRTFLPWNKVKRVYYASDFRYAGLNMPCWIVELFDGGRWYLDPKRMEIAPDAFAQTLDFYCKKRSKPQ